MKVPAWHEAREALESGRELTPIEQFVYDNDPAGLEESNEFLTGLQSVIDYVKGNCREKCDG